MSTFKSDTTAMRALAQNLEKIRELPDDYDARDPSTWPENRPKSSSPASVDALRAELEETEKPLKDEEILASVKLVPALSEEEITRLEVDVEDSSHEIAADLNTKFRLSSQKVMLTYKGHVPKLSYIKWLKNLCASLGEIKFVRLAHETGDRSCEYNHTHVLIDFGKAPNFANPRKFDIKVLGDEVLSPLNEDYDRDESGKLFSNDVAIHPHIKGANKGKAVYLWKIWLKYIAKEDPENVDLLTEATTNAFDFYEAVEIMREDGEDGIVRRYGKSVRDFAGGLKGLIEACVKYLRNEERQMKAAKFDQWPEMAFPWQRMMMEKMNDTVHDRKVIWVCDNGLTNIGKSIMATYMKTKLNGMKIVGIPREADFSRGVLNYLDRKFLVGKKASSGCERIFAFDLEMKYREAGGIYAYVERLKNGAIFSGKYDSADEDFASPHVIVFSNFYPDVSPTNLAVDRWEIIELVKGSEITQDDFDKLPENKRGSHVRWNIYSKKTHIDDFEKIIKYKRDTQLGRGDTSYSPVKQHQEYDSSYKPAACAGAGMPSGSATEQGPEPGLTLNSSSKTAGLIDVLRLAASQQDLQAENDRLKTENKSLGDRLQNMEAMMMKLMAKLDIN